VLTPVDDISGCFHSLEFFYQDCTVARQLGGVDDIAISPDGKSVYVASYADNSILVFDRDPMTGAISLSPAEDGCTSGDGLNECAKARGLDGPRGIIVSPDSNNVYVASAGPSGGIAAFDRNMVTGDLTQKSGQAGCLNGAGVEGCASAPLLLLDTRGIAISSDGKSVYAGSRTHDVITIYDRDAEGELTIKPGAAGCINEAGDSGCRNGTALVDPDAITVSPDGESVYVGASRSDAIAVFDRDTTSGALTQKVGTTGCISNTGAADPMQAGTAGSCADGMAMDEINSVAVLPDGSALYATAGKSSGIVVLERRADGSLAQRPAKEGCITAEGYEDPSLSWTAGLCEDGRALLRAADVATDIAGGHVYTTAREGGVGMFDVVAPPTLQPPPPPEAEPVPPPSRVSTACRRAERKVRRTEHRLSRIRRRLHRESRRARLAASRSSRDRHASAVHRARRSLSRAEVTGQKVRRRMRRLCWQ
jgi:DNA-binding beta-propeller fold protein YncE